MEAAGLECLALRKYPYSPQWIIVRTMHDLGLALHVDFKIDPFRRRHRVDCLLNPTRGIYIVEMQWPGKMLIEIAS